MDKIVILIVSVILLSCGSTKYYVVRHAEKESSTMSSDVALSEQGKQRAHSLRMALAAEKISEIYSTNYLRTRSTVQPLADALGLTVKIYQPMDTSFFNSLRLSKKNTVITGHSNTVDDIVNHLTGQKLLKDLPDDQYGDLFIITRKGKKFNFETRRF
jgi:2,3-bisphosphoglycerate-dependent phosphoglycerate mutase